VNSRIRVDDKGLSINEQAVPIPCDLALLRAMLGEPRITTGSHDIATWDAVGIYAYCPHATERVA